MKTKIELLIAKMEAARTQLDEALVKIAPEIEIYPNWKLKQLLDHIAGWDELVLGELKAYQNGITPTQTVDGINQFNARSVSDRKALTLDQSRQAYDLLRADVLQTLRSLPEELLDRKYDAPWGGNCTITSIVKIFVSHEREHARQIEEIISHPATIG